MHISTHIIIIFVKIKFQISSTMDSNFNIFKQLTKNLSFSKEKTLNLKPQPVNHLVMNLDSSTNSQPELKKSNKRKLDTIDSTEQSDSFNLLGSVSIEAKTNKKDKKKDKKSAIQTLEQIKIEQVNHMRNVHQINVFGEDIPDPFEQFEHLISSYKNIPQQLVDNLAQFKFKEPTGVQMQAIPIMLNVKFIIKYPKTLLKF